MANLSGRLLLVIRLARADMRRRAVEVALLLLALAVATTTLTVGLLLHGESSAPYERTRVATSGPDVVASVFPRTGASVSGAQMARLRRLENAPEVSGHSGPYPVTWTALAAGGLSAGAEVEGRDRAPAAIDQPAVLTGTWVQPGEVVVEASFADALGVATGDRVRLGGRSFRVAGIAVTAALPPYPQICTVGCILTARDLRSTQPGLVWLTRADARSMVSPAEPLTFLLNLALRHPGRAAAFAAGHQRSGMVAPILVAWQELAARQGELLRNERAVVLLGSSLLGVLAAATLVVLVGGRLADERRRVGVLKAVGSSPGFIAAVLLVEYLTVAVAATGVGLVLGRLVAPLLTAPSTGVLGRAGSPSLTIRDAAVVGAVTLVVTVMATLVPTVRAARASTVRSLADVERLPRRGRAVITASAHLPPPLLIGLRLMARRPRRALLACVGIGIAVCGTVVVLLARAKLSTRAESASGLVDPVARRLDQVMLAVTVLLTVMALASLVFVAAATALDARIPLAVTRAVGASARQATAGLAVAQVLPAIIGVLLGAPAAFVLFAALDRGDTSVRPPWLEIAALLLATVCTSIALTALSARLGSRRSIADLLRAERS